MRRLLLCCMALVVSLSCNSRNNSEAVFKDPLLYSKTVHELNTVVMGNNFSPIVASRSYLYANVAAYEVLSGGYPRKYNSLAGQLRDLQSVPKPEQNKKINIFSALQNR